MDLFPIHLFVILVLANRYVLGRILRTLRRGQLDQVDDAFEPTVAIVSATTATPGRVAPPLGGHR